VSLADELEGVARLAASRVGPGDAVSAVIPTEPAPGRRIYLCAFDDADAHRSWLALDGSGEPVATRKELREAISIAALCEVAAEAAGGGDLDALVSRLEELREVDAPPGIETAEDAARALRVVVGEPPQVATPARLDEIGMATRRLEQALDPTMSSPFASAMRGAEDAVAELQREVEAGYRIPLG
jgi:hypothetical protein